MDPSGSINVNFSLAEGDSSITSITWRATGSSLSNSTLFMPKGVKSHKSFGDKSILLFIAIGTTDTSLTAQLVSWLCRKSFIKLRIKAVLKKYIVRRKKWIKKRQQDKTKRDLVLPLQPTATTNPLVGTATNWNMKSNWNQTKKNMPSLPARTHSTISKIQNGYHTYKYFLKTFWKLKWLMPQHEHDQTLSKKYGWILRVCRKCTICYESGETSKTVPNKPLLPTVLGW